MRMPLAQVPNRSSAVDPHFLRELGVALRKALKRIPRPQVVDGRERRIDKIQMPAPDLAEKQSTSLGITIQALDVLPEHVEDLFVEVHKDSFVRRRPSIYEPHAGHPDRFRRLQSGVALWNWLSRTRVRKVGASSSLTHELTISAPSAAACRDTVAGKGTYNPSHP